MNIIEESILELYEDEIISLEEAKILAKLSQKVKQGVKYARGSARFQKVANKMQYKYLIRKRIYEKKFRELAAKRAKGLRGSEISKLAREVDKSHKEMLHARMRIANNVL